MHGGKMSHFLFFWLLLLENASHFIGRLTLLEESDELERVSVHCFVQVCEFELMHLGMCKEDLFTLLLRRGYFHHSMEVATLKIAKKLYSMLHELVHQHESRLFGSAKPADQLVANIGEHCNGRKVIPDALVEVCLHTICIVGVLLPNDAGPFSQVYIFKTLAHQVKQ
jgi:hypothetical protein